MDYQLVSIIVTVYNIENYLPHCLKSIREQTFQNIEVILIDDGSTDSSGKICDNFATLDPRYRVIHQQNQGACIARNTGKREAVGDFLYFMDGDDYMDKNAIKLMYEAINSNNKYDLAIIGHKRTDIFEEHATSYSANDNYELNDYEMMEKLMGGTDDMELAGYCWNKLYRRSLIDGVAFRQFVPMEDFDFNLRTFLKLNKAIIIPRILYFYVQRSTSLVNSPKKRWVVWSQLTKLLFQNYLELSPNESQRYGTLIIEKLYFIMQFYKVTSWKTEHQDDAFSYCHNIEKKTTKQFISNNNIKLHKKIYRLALLHSVWLTKMMMQLRGWKH